MSGCVEVQVAVAENWKSALLEVIDADQLPVHWGGTATDDDGDPCCRSRVGGLCSGCSVFFHSCTDVSSGQRSTQMGLGFTHWAWGPNLEKSYDELTKNL